jgi:hypothetical protein
MDGLVAVGVTLALVIRLTIGLGLFPGFVLRALEGVTASLPGLQPPAAMVWDGLGMSVLTSVRSRRRALSTRQQRSRNRC